MINLSCTYYSIVISQPILNQYQYYHPVSIPKKPTSTIQPLSHSLTQLNDCRTPLTYTRFFPQHCPHIQHNSHCSIHTDRNNRKYFTLSSTHNHKPEFLFFPTEARRRGGGEKRVIDYPLTRIDPHRGPTFIFEFMYPRVAEADTKPETEPVDR